MNIQDSYCSIQAATLKPLAHFYGFRIKKDDTWHDFLFGLDDYSRSRRWMRVNVYVSNTRTPTDDWTVGGFVLRFRLL